MEMQRQGLNSGDDGGARHVGLDPQNSKPGEHHMIPIWFFVGVILLIYGIIILGEGVHEFSSPPPTVLASTHPALWWGGLLAVIGAIYVYVHMPKKI